MSLKKQITAFLIVSERDRVENGTEKIVYLNIILIMSSNLL